MNINKKYKKQRVSGKCQSSKFSICFVFHLGSNYAVHTGENGSNISPQKSHLWETSSERQDKRLDPAE